MRSAVLCLGLLAGCSRVADEPRWVHLAAGFVPPGDADEVVLAQEISPEQWKPHAERADQWWVTRPQTGGYRGLTGDTLPSVVREAGAVDLFVHDAGHSRDDYVNDFTSVVDSLQPGSIVLFDDIRWDDPRFCETPPRCYEGWREVAAHSRVCHAVEVGSNMGLLRLS